MPLDNHAAIRDRLDAMTRRWGGPFRWPNRPEHPSAWQLAVQAARVSGRMRAATEDEHEPTRKAYGATLADEFHGHALVAADLWREVARENRGCVILPVLMLAIAAWGWWYWSWL